MPITIPEMVSAERTLRRVRFLMISSIGFRFSSFEFALFAESHQSPRSP